MKNGMKLATIGVLALMISVNPVLAEDHLLKDNKEVFLRLKNVAIAHEIRENCESIVANEGRVKRYFLGIVFYAGLRGFSQIEMIAHRDDVAEQGRLRVATHAYLDKNGVDRDAGTGYCTLGEKEMADKTRVGKLLKSG